MIRILISILLMARFFGSALIDKSEVRKVTFYLKQDLESLRDIVKEISNPHSDTYGEYLSQNQINKITSPKDEDVLVMTSWLEKNSIEYKMNLEHAKIDAWMNLKSAERLFDTSFEEHEGHTRLQAGDYRIPDDISNVTQAIFHLRGLPLPVMSPLSSSFSQGVANVTPSVLSTTYGIDGVKVEGGKNNRAAVAEFQGQTMKDSDLAEFFKSYVETYTVGVDDVVYKFVGDDNTQSGQVEASLDIQYIMGTAPHIKTEFWLWKGMDFCSDLKNWTETILSTSSPPLVHSVSYGWQGDLSVLNCEQNKIDAIDGDFTKLAARGISIIFASGDSGSGYTSPTLTCDGSVENIAWIGTVQTSLKASSAAQCCDIGSSFPETVGTSFTEADPSSGTCSCLPGDVGEKDKVFENGTVINKISVPANDRMVCCQFSQQGSRYFSFLPPTGNETEATCVIYSDVSGKKINLDGGYSGKSRDQGNCTLFSAITGNKTASSCTSVQRSKDAKVTLYPSWPASSPWVTAVGATRFVDQEVGRPEMATDQFGSGGGFSSMFDRSNATWQEEAVKHYLSHHPKDPSYPSGMFPEGGRATPDVSALGEGYQVYTNGFLQSVGGTSASAPAFAGMVALLNEARIQKGMPALGFLNPFLYQNADAFTDVTIGTNAISRGGAPVPSGFNCTKGWDPATGLGTPIFSKLLSAALK